MDKELLWIILPPMWGFLWAFGGWKVKDFRRLGIPISLVLVGWLYSVAWFPLLLSALLLGICLRLPFTIGGDSIKEWWQFAWLLVLGALLGACAFPLGATAISLLVPAMAFFLAGTASNLPQTAKMFPWKWCEVIFGVSASYTFCLALS